MKNINYLIIGIAGLMLASCANEEPAETVTGDLVNLNISLATTEIQSRGFADGKDADFLQYAVYEKDGNQYKKIIDKSEGQDFTENTNITLQLGKKRQYSVVFWVGVKTGSPYILSFENNGAEMTVDENAIKCNDSSLDAFYICKDLGEITGNADLRVDLTRPFAQINVGTDDYEIIEGQNASLVPTSSSIKIMGAPTKMNLLTGEMSEEKDLEFSMNSIKRDTEAFPKDKEIYNYLAMAYFLVEEKSSHDIEITFASDAMTKQRKVASVPMQRNRRTNIYGSILTSDQNITIEDKTGF